MKRQLPILSYYRVKPRKRDWSAATSKLMNVVMGILVVFGILAMCLLFVAAISR